MAARDTADIIPWTPDNRRRAIQRLGTVPADGRLVRLLFGPARVTRSNRANAYYWSCVVASFHDFLREQGESYTAEDCHEFLKCKHLLQTLVNRETGEVIGRAPRSTASLTTEEFADYLDRCIVWLADTFGIVVPDPREYGIERNATTSEGGIDSATSPNRVPRQTPRRGIAGNNQRSQEPQHVAS